MKPILVAVIMTLSTLTAAENKTVTVDIEDGKAKINGHEVIKDMTIKDFYQKILVVEDEPRRISQIYDMNRDEISGIGFRYRGDRNQEEIYCVEFILADFAQGRIKGKINGITVHGNESLEQLVKLFDAFPLEFPKKKEICINDKFGNSYIVLDESGKVPLYIEICLIK